MDTLTEVFEVDSSDDEVEKCKVTESSVLSGVDEKIYSTRVYLG